MAEVAIAVKSKRETVMDHVWGRCTEAWNEGDFDQAICLDRLHSTLVSMTDDDYEDRFECGCPDCNCQE